MQVFKAYFKVMRGAALSLAISLSIFMGLAVLFSTVAPENFPVMFESTRTSLAVINRDGDNPLTRGLIDYLGKTNRLLSFPDDQEKLQDALFYRRLEYIAIIPKGFTEAFLSGKLPAALTGREKCYDGAPLSSGEPSPCFIQKVIVPDSASSHYVDMAIDRFLNTLRLHRLYEKESPEVLVERTLSDLAYDTPVTMKIPAGANGSRRDYHYYFAYCAYALISMIVTGISSIMISFNRTDLNLRNLSAPLSRRKINLQIAAGHGVFALGCWVLLMAGAFVIYRGSLFASGLLGLYSLNTLVFAAVCSAIGFLAGGFVKSQGAQSGVVNATALGLCFLGGVFVPQSIMSKPVLAVARFLPSYWYIRVNDALGELSGLGGESLGSIYSSMLIQLGFAVAIFSVTLLLSRELRRS